MYTVIERVGIMKLTHRIGKLKWMYGIVQKIVQNGFLKNKE